MLRKLTTIPRRRFYVGVAVCSMIGPEVGAVVGHIIHTPPLGSVEPDPVCMAGAYPAEWTGDADIKAASFRILCGIEPPLQREPSTP